MDQTEKQFKITALTNGDSTPTGKLEK